MPSARTSQQAIPVVAAVDDLQPGSAFDCILLAHDSEASLTDLGRVSNLLAHLSTNGVIVAPLPTQYAVAMPPDLEATLESARIAILLTEPVNDFLSIFFLARESCDLVAHAQQLAEAGMPARAFSALEWLQLCVHLSDEQIAALAATKLAYLRQMAAADESTPTSAVLFHAQKQFQIAIHQWPLRPHLYHHHASIWRKFGNDDYAARLLRSIESVSPHEQTRRLLEELKPQTTVQPPAESSPEWSGVWKPRVLLLTHDNSDYGLDTLYDGLCQILGSANVIEFPWKATLHGRDREATLNYPCFFDYPAEPRTPDEIEQQLRAGEFDLIVFADFVQMNRQDIVRGLLDAAPTVPLVIYDPWDDGSATASQATAYLGRQPAVYFKREMLACIDYGPNAYPLPFGYPDRHVPTVLPDHREHDLFWAGKRLFGTRSLYLHSLTRLLGRSLDVRYPQDEYARVLAHSRIGLSLFGFGFDTVRYWELAAHGCMLLAERPLIRIPFNFLEGESASYFDDLPELEEKLSYYLSHPGDVARIARAGREQFLRHHTTSARARQFLGRIEQSLSK